MNTPDPDKETIKRLLKSVGNAAKQQEAVIECRSDIKSFANIQSSEQFVQDSVDFSSPESFDWELISFAAFLKDELKKRALQKETVLAYLRAAKVVYAFFRADNNPMPGVKGFKDNQMCLPLLFLCRHTVEIAIKYFYANKDKSDPPITHNIKTLWNKTKPALKLAKDELRGMEIFIEMIDRLDDNGEHFRYTTDKKGIVYQDKPTFIKVDRIIKCTELLVDLLLDKSNEK